MKSPDVKALFLGPKAENQNLYQSLILEAVLDQCFLRKNFHPEDKPLITESNKLTPEFNETIALFKQQYNLVLSELKKAVPLYHPRYFGHMHGDLQLPGIAAYFATMLYNPNNVVGESSLATTKMEIDFINALCQMVGYKPCTSLGGSDQAWGHLCSGGTSANIESLWVARNLKYYPLAVKLASYQSEFQDLKNILINELNATIGQLSFKDLFNLSLDAILELKDHAYSVKKEITKSRRITIEKHSVTNLGVYGIHKAIEQTANEILPLPKVYIAKSQHYCWKKAMDIIGLGQNQMEDIEVDKGFRMDIDDLRKKLNEKDTPVLAVIAVYGSSKQGSIDPLDKITELRDQKQITGKSFFVHTDAAYGGYLTSMMLKGDDSTEYMNNEEILNYLMKNHLNETITFFKHSKNNSNDRFPVINMEWCEKVKAISKSDSITIDPHKMGYIPYPAGCILFSDTRMKDFISYEPSYLNKSSDETDLYSSFLGQWTLEGSRPGATAAACYLSSMVLPFNKNGHGNLVKNTIHSANSFWNAMQPFRKNPDESNGIKIVPVYVPEMNIVSYIVSAPEIVHEVKYLNELNKSIYDKFSVNGKSIIPAQNYLIAKDEFEYSSIPDLNILRDCNIGVADIEKDEKITYLSSVFMNPLSIYLDGDFYSGFWNELAKTAKDIVADIQLSILKTKLEEIGKDQFKILWIENDSALKKLEKEILYDRGMASCLNIKFNSDIAKAGTLIKKTEWDICILDLNLETSHDRSSNISITEIKAITNTIELLKDVSNDKRNKIVFYSSYLGETELQIKIKEIMHNKLSFLPLDKFFIAKNNDFSTDKRKLVNAIFSLLA